MQYPNEYLVVLPDGRQVSNYSRDYLHACEHWELTMLEPAEMHKLVAHAAAKRSETHPARREAIASALLAGTLAMASAKTGMYALWPKRPSDCVTA